MFLPDINFWLALAFQAHQHHVSAKLWMQSAPHHSCCFCRITQMGFLRLATNPKALPGHSVSMKDAWIAYERILIDERVAFAHEPAEIETTWRSLTEQESISQNVWTDAYLAAFAKAAGFDLISFDKGFAKYTGLQTTILS
jgi:toxin-antitoxin system PIN domain toxin